MSGHERADWEARWFRALETHGERLAERPPNAWLTSEVADLPAGRALDAGCGHGAEALWLAARGWTVTAVDFSAAALAHARATADGRGLAVDWVEADLGTWVPPAAAYDLVVCLYVHVAGDVGAFVDRIATGVAPGGTLLLVGHRPVDPRTGAATAAASQTQVSVADAEAALGPLGGELVVAEERPRALDESGVDAVIRWRKR
jgi:2-polyprenyl-3-methyl-5-hydroxy-6-metoxy-1,4-benzoquinol methylase